MSDVLLEDIHWKHQFKEIINFCGKYPPKLFLGGVSFNLLLSQNCNIRNILDKSFLTLVKLPCFSHRDKFILKGFFFRSDSELASIWSQINIAVVDYVLTVLNYANYLRIICLRCSWNGRDAMLLLEGFVKCWKVMTFGWITDVSKDVSRIFREARQLIPIL